MKYAHSETPSFRILMPFCLAFVLLTLALTAKARVLDNGVDSENLGKGQWIYQLWSDTNHLVGTAVPGVPSVTNADSMMAYFKNNLNIDFIIVKAGTGSTNFTDPSGNRVFTAALVNSAHAAGLKVFGYTRSYGSDIPGEVQIADYCFTCGADGFVLDAEMEWEKSSPWIGTNGPLFAMQLCGQIKTNHPTKFLGHSPFANWGDHSTFPYKEFGYWCDAVMPQVYWIAWAQSTSTRVQQYGTPDAGLGWTDTSFLNFYNTLTKTNIGQVPPTFKDPLGASWTNAIKPISPVANAFNPDLQPTGDDIIQFCNAIRVDTNLFGLNPWGFANASPSGYQSVNFFEAGWQNQGMLNAIRLATAGPRPAGPPVITGVGTIGVSDTSATIYWVTDENSTSVVEYGTDLQLNNSAADTNIVGAHRITLSGLAANSLYYYRVRSTDLRGNEGLLSGFSFVTLPSSSSTNPVIIIDNTDAVATGTWSVGTSASDKYGADYLVQSQGAGSDFVAYTPNIPSAGWYDIYEWHTQGGNRTTAAPYIVTSGDGTETNYVDQSTKGGSWNYVKTHYFNRGTGGNVKICDGFAPSGKVVIADAIKFVSNPTVMPSNLQAVGADSTQTYLSWTDNSAGQNSYVISRSLLPGGPYVDVAYLPPGVTSYYDQGLCEGTTYYYLLRGRLQGNDSQPAAEASAMTFPDAPSIIQQPQSLPTLPGGTAKFTVAALSASSLPSFQWQLNGVNIPGATDAVYTVTNISSANFGNYQVLVANRMGFVKSQVASLGLGYTISLSASPAQAGILAKSPDLPIYPPGTTVLLSAVSADTNNFAFLDWSGGVSGSSASISITVAGNVQAVANFAALSNSLSFSVSPVRGGSISKSPDLIVYSNGTPVVVTAVPADGYIFTGWSGNVQGTSNPITVTAIGNQQLTANFIKTTPDRSVFPAQTGTISMSPATSSYNLGDPITLTAVPANGFAFACWSGDIQGTSNPITISARNNQQVTANFINVSQVIVDNPDAFFSGPWALGTAGLLSYGGFYDWANGVIGGATAEASYVPNIIYPGKYDVYIWYPQSSTFSTNTPIMISCADGILQTNIDQSTNGGSWRLLASGLDFTAGNSGYVDIFNSTGDTSRPVAADAVRFSYISSPIIINQPQSQIAAVGGTTSFDVTAGSAEATTYQWQFNGVNIAGATNSHFALSNVQLSNAGTYSVNISNRGGAITSAAAVLTVVAPSSPRLSPLVLSNGQVQFSLTGQTNLNYSIDVSTNLINWTSVTNIFNSDGAVNILVPVTGDKMRFYRSRWVP